MSTMEERAADRHNKLAIEITKKLVTNGLMMMMTSAEMMVVLESIVVGVILAQDRMMGEEILVDELAQHVKERLFLARDTKGSA